MSGLKRMSKDVLLMEPTALQALRTTSRLLGSVHDYDHRQGKDAETLKVLAKETSCQQIYKTMSTLSQSPLKTRDEDEANFQTPPNPHVITITLYLLIYVTETH